MWPGVKAADYCPLGQQRRKHKKALLRCLTPLSHMTTYRDFPQPSRSISSPWTHYRSSNTILTIHPSPSPTIYPTFPQIQQRLVLTKTDSHYNKKVLIHFGTKSAPLAVLDNFILIFCNKNAHLWQNCTFGNFGQFYTNILEQKCTFVTEMHICNKDALLVIDQIIKSFLSTILQTFFGFFSDNKKKWESSAILKESCTFVANVWTL